MNRAERRKMSKHDLEEARERTQDELASILLCVWLNVLHDDGESYERLCDLVNKVTDEYDRVTDWEKYRIETYEKVGISLRRS